jgi:hypothetical protein
MVESIEEAVEYLRNYHRNVLANPGLDSSLIPDDLPHSLALIYRELGALVELSSFGLNDRRPFSTQDSLVPLSGLKRINGLIEFAWENQGNWSARCVTGLVDPPVFTNAGEEGAGCSEFEQVCDSLSSFLITLALHEAVMSSPMLFNFDDYDVVQAFDDLINPIWLNGPYAIKGFHYDFYDIPGKDILILKGPGTWVGAHSEEASQFIRARYRGLRIS